MGSLLRAETRSRAALRTRDQLATLRGRASFGANNFAAPDCPLRPVLGGGGGVMASSFMPRPIASLLDAIRSSVVGLMI